MIQWVNDTMVLRTILQDYYSMDKTAGSLPHFLLSIKYMSETQSGNIAEDGVACVCLISEKMCEKESTLHSPKTRGWSTRGGSERQPHP